MRRLLFLAVIGLAGCGGNGDTRDFAYLQGRTSALDASLIQTIAPVQRLQRSAEEELLNAVARDYALCLAAHYALTEGFGFARLVRTQTTASKGVWQADAVYAISDAFPPGNARIDVEVTVADCRERRIPVL
ncbi:MAG: hypothetical protein AAFY03_02290 [Pseudomonadota bacterium]